MQDQIVNEQRVHFAEEAPICYVNFARIAVGPYDVRFDFGLVNLMKSNSEKLELERPVTIVMSRKHFLALRNMIEQAYKGLQGSKEKQ